MPADDQARLEARPEARDDILGLRTQIVDNAMFLRPNKPISIITLSSSPGNRWSARVMTSDEAIAITEFCPTAELALRALLEETSKMIWDSFTPVYSPY